MSDAVKKINYVAVFSHVVFFTLGVGWIVLLVLGWFSANFAGEHVFKVVEMIDLFMMLTAKGLMLGVVVAFISLVFKPRSQGVKATGCSLIFFLLYMLVVFMPEIVS